MLTGLLIDSLGWRSAFYIPGLISILLGISYLIFIKGDKNPELAAHASSATGKLTDTPVIPKNILIRIFGIVIFTTALGGLIFQSTTFALPKIFDERLVDLAGTPSLIGWYAFLVFSLAALAQLVIGYLVDHHSVRRVFAAVAILQAICFFLMAHLEGVAALLVAFAFMFVVFGQIPINDVLVGRIARSEWRSRAFAMRYLVTFSVMASAVPMIGWIHQNWGFDKLFNVLSIAASAIFIAVLLLPGTSSIIRRQNPGTT